MGARSAVCYLEGRGGRWIPDLSELWFLSVKWDETYLAGLLGGLNRFSVAIFHPCSGC